MTVSTILPALSASDVGIAISDGAEIAREIADVTIAAEDLREIVTLKELSNALMKRIHRNYRNNRRFQYRADCPGRDRYFSAHHLRTAAQYFHNPDQCEEHEEPAERQRRAGVIRLSSRMPRHSCFEVRVISQMV